jgi:hypothetical protein
MPRPPAPGTWLRALVPVLDPWRRVVSHRRHRPLIVLAILGLVATWYTDPVIAQSEPTTLRVIHAMPDVTAIDVSLDGGRVAEGLAYTAASNRLPSPGGMARLRVTAAGDAARLLLDTPIELPTVGPSTILLAGLTTGAPPLTALVLKDDLGYTSQDRIRLRFVHAAVGLAGATLIAGENTVLFEEIPYAGTGDAVLDPGRFALRVTSSPSTAAVIAETALVANPGRTYTVLLAGQAGATHPPALIAFDHSAAPQRRALLEGPAAPGTVLVEETFADPVTGMMPAAAPAESPLIYGYADGEYWLRNLEVATRSVAVPIDGTNATIAVDARLIGETAQRTVSVGCRFASDAAGNRGYRLRVEPAAGLFRLVREDGARDTFLRRDSRSPAIRGATEVNRLELTCAGSTITAAINGTVVATVQDSTYTSGSLVFGVGARASGLTSEARFDNLVITAR